MKSLSKLDAVVKALETVVAESDVNNGTRGLELFCYYWSHENQYDEMRQTLFNEKVRLTLAGKPDEANLIGLQIEALPKPKIIMEFKLVTPLPLVRGTKTISDGNKLYTIQANNVTSIFIPEDSVMSELGKFEETGDIAKDIVGRDSPIIKLVIEKGLLDVAAEILDSRDSRKPLEQRRIIRGKRVYLTAVSYHAMQVVGRLQGREQFARQRRYGFNEQL